MRKLVRCKKNKKTNKKTVSKATTKDKPTKTARNAEMDLLIENWQFIQGDNAWSFENKSSTELY